MKNMGHIKYRSPSPLGTVSPVTPPIQPSVQRRRVRFHQRQKAATRSIARSAQYLGLRRIKTAHVCDILLRQKDAASMTNDIGFWLSTKAPNHPNGYRVINLRKARRIDSDSALSTRHASNCYGLYKGIVRCGEKDGNASCQPLVPSKRLLPSQACYRRIGYM